MSQVLTEYITQQYDRLDLIAFRAYGDSFRIRPLLDANPSLPLMDFYPSGIRIVVPVISRGTDTVSRSLLPPWKR